jgi:hypothetical protein
MPNIYILQVEGALQDEDFESIKANYLYCTEWYINKLASRWFDRLTYGCVTIYKNYKPILELARQKDGTITNLNTEQL